MTLEAVEAAILANDNAYGAMLSDRRAGRISQDAARALAADLHAEEARLHDIRFDAVPAAAHAPTLTEIAPAAPYALGREFRAKFAGRCAWSGLAFVAGQMVRTVLLTDDSGVARIPAGCVASETLRLISTPAGVYRLADNIDALRAKVDALPVGASFETVLAAPVRYTRTAKGWAVGLTGQSGTKTHAQLMALVFGRNPPTFIRRIVGA